MRVAVCDDDERELDYLSGLIAEYQLSRGVRWECCFFHSSVDFLSDVRAREYDLVLLDVVMPGVDGIKAAQELREKDKNVKLIFISLSPEFAVDSYSVEAYHYLLKPVEGNSLFPLLDKVRQELSVQNEQGFVLKNREGAVRLAFAEIEFAEVMNKKVFFHLTGGAVREITAALAELEGKLLSRPEFIKTHRSFIVNLSHVQSVGMNDVVTRGGDHVLVSRKRRGQVQNACMSFWSHGEEAGPVQGRQTGLSSPKQACDEGPWRILLVDDEPADRTFWADILRCHGCRVDLAGNGKEALKLAENERYDCILLDVMIPGEDGFFICENLRRRTDAPVIFLSCVTEPDRQVEGFAAGGTDYITKDTSAGLFWAKVEARIRPNGSGCTLTSFGPLAVDFCGRTARMNGEELSLTVLELDILRRLSERPGHVFTPEEIFRMVWGDQPWDGGKQVQSHMSGLRRKLEKAWGEHHYIEAVWGQGYRFVLPEHCERRYE